MNEAFVCDAVRTPIGRYGGTLSSVRADDLAALPITALIERTGLDPSAIHAVLLGCAHQASEDNRHVPRMPALVAGLPARGAGLHLNRLYASALNAGGVAA